MRTAFIQSCCNTGRGFPRACRPAILIAVAVCTAGCGDPEIRREQPRPLVERISRGPVSVTITAEPPLVHPARDVFLTIRTESPPSVDVLVPPVSDRLTGFSLRGSFDRDPVEEGDRVSRERHIRLTPTLAEEFRIGPIAITVVDNRTDPPETSWFATRPMTFGAASLVANGQESVMRDIVDPARVIPPFRVIVSWIPVALLLILAAAAAWTLLRQIRRSVRLHIMSPGERALRELSDLVAGDLVAKGRIKDFYIELTMIVRRYIERAHKIRAPEQTTDEFLAAAAKHPGFSPGVVRRLHEFLESADLVKFAAFRPDTATLNRSVDTARNYIQTDGQTGEREEEPGV